MFASFRVRIVSVLLLIFCLLSFAPRLVAQADEGTLTGSVQDASGATVPGVRVDLSEIGTSVRRHLTTGPSGVFAFTLLRAGSYELTLRRDGFEQLHVSPIKILVNQRTGLALHLKTGSVTTSITVQPSADELQREEATVGQGFSSQSLDETPMTNRNWVFLAQLAAGVAEPPDGARGANTGDFSANGQRPEQNNFLLDGIDNNTYLADVQNGASFVMKPPPDALQQFKVQTSNYSAELGHSAGAVVNASLRSGTNTLHGSLWEYLRNDIFNGRDYFQTDRPKYRQNQFGATLGGPILRNRLYFFADVEANRAIFGQTGTYSVPTLKMRTGDFTELLQPALTNQNFQRTLYRVGSAGTALQQCNGQQNVICANQMDAVASRLIQLFPKPNLGVVGQTYNNYLAQTSANSNTTQYDVRVDWTASARDTAFARYSYTNKIAVIPPPLGLLDGGSQSSRDQGRNFGLSETHIFSSRVINEFRFGYNWLSSQSLQANSGRDLSAELGLGGIPFTPINGGLPYITVSSISSFGSPTYKPGIENQNSAQLQDTVSVSVGRHLFKAGLVLQRIRFNTLQPQYTKGYYQFTNKFTDQPSNQARTGFALADFLQGQIASSSLNNLFQTHDQRWYRAGFIQDDWKLTTRLTLNLGLRYDYGQPIEELDGRQSNFVPDYVRGGGEFLIPRKAMGTPLPVSFVAAAVQNGIAIRYVDNNFLVNPDMTNVSARVGVAYALGSKTVLRGAYGRFYGPIENQGFSPNLGQNVPFGIASTFPSAACSANACPNNGQTLATGFATAIAAGLGNFSSTPSLRYAQVDSKNAYTDQWNLTLERQLPGRVRLTTAYVGSHSEHLQLDPDPNQIAKLLPPGSNAQSNTPYPQFGTNGRSTIPAGFANYNGLQMTGERQAGSSLHFLATYTFARALDAAFPPLGANNFTFTSIRNFRQLGFGYDYGNSYQDVRHRTTLSVDYTLPFGRGRHYLNHVGWTNSVVGGWKSHLVFRAQSGNPELAFPAGDPTNGVGTAYAYLNADPFQSGQITSNTGATCAQTTKTLANWINPCAYNNPNQASGPDDIQAYGPKGRTLIYGPGYNRTDLSLSKSFRVYREHRVMFRAEAYNLFNTPAFAKPARTVGSGFGQITATRFGGRGEAAIRPDSRYLQFSLKYQF